MSSKKLNNVSDRSKHTLESKKTPRSGRANVATQKKDPIIHDRHELDQQTSNNNTDSKELFKTLEKIEKMDEEVNDKTFQDFDKFIKTNEEEKEQNDDQNTEIKPIIKDSINDAPELKLHFLEKWITHVFNFLEKKGITIKFKQG